MKKLLTLALSLILAVCCFGLIACSKDDGVEGTYNIVSMTYEGQTFNIGDDAPWGEELTKNSFVLNIKADNVVVATSNMGGMEHSETGTWALEGSTITFVLDGETTTATVDGDKITWEEDELSYLFKKA